MSESLAAQLYRALVTVHAPAAELKKLRWLGGTIEPIDDSRCRYCTSDDQLDWLAMIGHESEVHEPPELIERLLEMSDRIARATAPCRHRSPRHRSVVSAGCC